MCVYEGLHVGLYATCVAGVHREHKRISDSLEPELHAVVDVMWMLKIELKSFQREANALKH